MNRSLLVDKNYMALSIIPWKKAVRLLVKGKAEPIGYGDVTLVKTGEGAFSIPSIIRLVVTIPWRAHQGRMKFSRRNVMLRDEYNCQYCNIHVGKNGGTIDHVVPRAKGGKTTYTNCVTSCKACNNLKADRAPEDVGMKLKEQPKKPSFLMLYKRYLNEYSPNEWADYIIGL